MYAFFCYFLQMYLVFLRYIDSEILMVFQDAEFFPMHAGFYAPFVIYYGTG